MGGRLVREVDAVGGDLVLHRFQSAGMVFAGIVISGFGTLFVLGLAMSILGIGPETLSTGGTF